MKTLQKLAKTPIAAFALLLVVSAADKLPDASLMSWLFGVSAPVVPKEIADTLQ